MKKEVHKNLTIILTVLFIGYLLMGAKVLYKNEGQITGLIIQDINLTEFIPLESIFFIVIGIIIFSSLIINTSVYQWKNSLEKEIDLKTVQLQEVKNDIEQRNSELKKTNKKLEEAQNELNKEIEELEKFNRLAVGRELKMVELKRKIKELEEKTKK